jgi:hypothetical protein
MFQTAFTLTLTQFARSLSLPERLQRSPARNLALEALRLRNTTLDALFYDVKVITTDEVFYISDSLAAEGSIMIVPPTGRGSLTLCETLDEFVLRGGGDVHALAVAGVGGSALGAAAFARNVADAVNGPVAVVVSGYGLADIVNEAFGGLFFFGHLKGVRPAFERLDDFAGRTKFGAASADDDPAASRTCLDTQTVRALLTDRRLSFKLLAGHSKGNLVLAAALHDLASRDPNRAGELADGLRIVTFGARIAMPPVFSDVADVIGEWDWFGEMNSRLYLAADRRVPRAWHHTNTDLSGHLPVTNTLRELLSQPPGGEKAQAKAEASTKKAAQPETSRVESVEAKNAEPDVPSSSAPKEPGPQAALAEPLPAEPSSAPKPAEKLQTEQQPAVRPAAAVTPLPVAVAMKAAPSTVAEPAPAPRAQAQPSEAPAAAAPRPAPVASPAVKTAVTAEAAPSEVAGSALEAKVQVPDAQVATPLAKAASPAEPSPNVKAAAVTSEPAPSVAATPTPAPKAKAEPSENPAAATAASAPVVKAAAKALLAKGGPAQAPQKSPLPGGGARTGRHGRPKSR